MYNGFGVVCNAHIRSTMANLDTALVPQGISDIRPRVFILLGANFTYESKVLLLRTTRTHTHNVPTNVYH